MPRIPRPKSAKRALLLSMFTLLLCMSMLIGSTFAWFTDAVSSSSNIISTGNLKVTMEWKDATIDADTYKDASNKPIFSSDDKWEPGFIEAKTIKITNSGSLALKYKLNIITVGTISRLSDVIEVYYATREPDIIIGNDTLPDYFTRLGSLSSAMSSFGNTAFGDLLENESDFITIVLKMPANADNDLQGLSVGSEFAVQLMATQLSHENDSFGNNYDEDAGFNYGKTNIGPYKLSVLPNGNVTYDDATKTYNISVDTVAQGAYNASNGNKYYAGYTVNVAGYGEGATVKFDKNGSEVVWSLADEERDGFITNGLHQQWTSVGTSRTYHYDINGDGVTDFSVINDATAAKVEVADIAELNKAIETGVSAILTNDIDLGATQITIPVGRDIVLDLNKHTVSAINSETKASCAISNFGNLTINNGTLTYQGVGDPSFGYGTNTITNSGGLTINNATIINATNSGSSNAIDNAPGSTLVVNSGVLKSEKITVRLRDGSNVTINGGEIYGARAVQIHLFQNMNADTTLTINGGIFTADYALYSYAYNNCTFARTTVNITDGTFNGIVAFGGGNKTAKETVTVTGGTFNYSLGRYLANDGWESITVTLP